jgi:threonine/homoserine/homoserine lactone efflux protein
VPDIVSFAVAATALLILPGPTNALLAAAGARALWDSLALLPVVLAAYGVSIAVVFLALAGGADADPRAGAAVRILAAVYLLWLAMRLWRRARVGAPGGNASVRPREVFVATLLNPKGLILALLLPPEDRIAGHAAMLAAAILATGLLWVSAGHAVGRLVPGLVAGGLVDRVGAVVVAGFALYFLATAAVTLMPG